MQKQQSNNLMWSFFELALICQFILIVKLLHPFGVEISSVVLEKKHLVKRILVETMLFVSDI